ncbi:hypothetical protein L6452_19347 [Arctium lappa]|uniref:Uncharacterized protein n=1 Tax=Arctium lappa TaxID=4217 RepID=A0ACB9BA52_ARCLA|nr:hypothetical protein L6452_19347 [Arctium lappa]
MDTDTKLQRGTIRYGASTGIIMSYKLLSDLLMLNSKDFSPQILHTLIATCKDFSPQVFSVDTSSKAIHTLIFGRPVVGLEKENVIVEHDSEDMKPQDEVPVKCTFSRLNSPRVRFVCWESDCIILDGL